MISLEFCHAWNLKPIRFVESLCKVHYGVNVELLVLLLFGYEHVYVHVYIFVLYILYYLMYLLLILTWYWHIHMYCWIIQNVQMQSPLFSSESFPIGFTVISYTHFFRFVFFNFTHFTLLCQFLISQNEKSVDLKMKDHVILIYFPDMSVWRMICSCEILINWRSQINLLQCYNATWV